MNTIAFFIDATAGGQVQQIAKTFGVDWPHLLAQVVSFSIVCFLLHRYAYKPVLAILEQRRRQIAEGIARSETIEAELAKTEAERHVILMQAGAEANKIIEEAHAAAAQVRKNETQKAMTAAEQIIAKAQEAAVQEHARMLWTLKSQLGQLVVQATAQVTGKVLTPDDHKRMAEETIQELAKAA